jgi:poly-beta-1,6-N-acetyl-D-glucosamine synthase
MEILRLIILTILCGGGMIYLGASVALWAGGLLHRRSTAAPLAPADRSAERPFVSVIVSARNEEHNIPALINALAAQDYPRDRWEAIIVDDRSEDATGDVVRRLLPRLPCRGRLIRQTEVPPDWSPKKHALTTTIQHIGTERGESARDVILTTDADCRPEPHWITGMMQTLGERDLVAGYSPFDRRTNIWRRMLALETLSIAFMALAGIRLGWPITCTGRSFAYRREVFEQASGYGEASAMLSGDDHLFLQRAVARGCRATYCTEPGSYVWTDPVNSLRGFWNQRIRMFSGVGRMTPGVATVGALAYVWMLTLLGGMVALWPPAWIAFAGKFLLDGVSLIIGARHFAEWRLLWAYPLTALLYVPYHLLFGLLGTFGSYDWKGSRGR